MPARRPTRALLLAAVLVVSLPAAASAHVTVQPGAVEGGGYAVVAFRVPNERDGAATTKVQVLLPDDQPLASVQTAPLPGWRVETTTRTLDEPIDSSGAQVSSVVSRVTWTATGEGIGPGQFEDFELSLGQLPDSGELVFKALQTYSDGDQVNWNQVAVEESVEPEHPAPVLVLTPPGPPATSQDAGQDSDQDSAVPLGLSVAALVVSGAALAVAWSARRRPAA